MWIAVHALGLFCLLGSVESQQPTPTPTPTPTTKNPECPAMHKAATRLEKGINLLLRQTSTCQVNQHCSGVNCTWGNGGFLEVDLHHCDDPIKYHIHFISPKYNKDEEKELKQGQTIQLYKNSILTFEIKATELQRTGNTVTTQIDLLTCNKITGSCPPTPLIPRQKLCVSMRNCPNYNASSSDNAPCNPFSPTPTHAPSPHGGKSSQQHDTPKHGTAAPGSKDHHKGDGGDSSDKLSVAAIIGISLAGLFVILIVAGVVVYWKKYHHRTRLRAAYYNDISMHDPLYEDFGPEVA